MTEAENDALSKHMMAYPEENHILANILNAKVEEQPGLVRIFLRPGEKAPNIEFVVEDDAKLGDGTSIAPAKQNVRFGRRIFYC